jgi:hypothetical protein
MRDLSNWIGLALLVGILVTGVTLLPCVLSFAEEGAGSCAFSALRSLAGLPIEPIVVGVSLWGLYRVYEYVDGGGF